MTHGRGAVPTATVGINLPQATKEAQTTIVTKKLFSNMFFPRVSIAASLPLVQYRIRFLNDSILKSNFAKVLQLQEYSSK